MTIERSEVESAELKVLAEKIFLAVLQADLAEYYVAQSNGGVPDSDWPLVRAGGIAEEAFEAAKVFLTTASRK